jgi:hypothetical protein
LFSPFPLSYHDINRRSFIIICIYILHSKVLIVKCSGALHSLFWVDMLTRWIWCMHIICSFFWKKWCSSIETSFGWKSNSDQYSLLYEDFLNCSYFDTHLCCACLLHLVGGPIRVWCWI